MKSEPTVHTFYASGNSCYKAWLVKNKLHSIGDNPASITYEDTGVIIKEEWYNNGKLHRDNKPARIWYNADGFKDHVEYFCDGMLHNLNGPAVVLFHPNGYIKKRYWHISGCWVTSKKIKETLGSNYTLPLTHEQKIKLKLMYNG